VAFSASQRPTDRLTCCRGWHCVLQ